MHNFNEFRRIWENNQIFLTRSQFGGWGWGGIVGNRVSNIRRSRGWETTIRDGRAEQGSVRFDAERRKMMIEMKLEKYFTHGKTQKYRHLGWISKISH